MSWNRFTHPYDVFMSTERLEDAATNTLAHLEKQSIADLRAFTDSYRLDPSHRTSGMSKNALCRFIVGCTADMYLQGFVWFRDLWDTPLYKECERVSRKYGGETSYVPSEGRREQRRTAVPG